ncbi:MAG TPA: hypothetical protein VGR14_05435 [Verrucomicrobiae bacterium]|jgi:hypothetical protein|nr:hypothetical protein [Verrucomicrobiae bacterium]
MPPQIIKIRSRFFVAVEGESEQSFVTWLQTLSHQELHIHLDAVLLGGGGFKSMLQKAVRLHKRGSRTGTYVARFLIVDRDRAAQGDWSIEKLRSEAAKKRIIVCVQNPNHEGLLLRMLPGMEREIPDATSVATKLKRRWPNYQKPMNARELERQFSIEDLLRVANLDADLGTFLKQIGLMGGT